MNTASELADRIVRHVHDPEYRPVKPRVIARQLGFGDEGYREVRRVVKWLVRNGQIEYGPNHLVTPPGHDQRKTNVVRGTFRRAAGGFGFIRPNLATDEEEAADDLFVPPGRTRGALDTDLVEARVRTNRDRPGGGVEAHIVKILERGRRQFTGTFATRGEQAVVFLDGTPYDEPVSVGDVRGLPLEKDDKVVVELVEFPGEDGTGGEGVILEVLGSSRNPAVDTMAVMRQFGLPEEFPEAVLDEAREQADAFDDSVVPEDRRDLTERLTITIDPHDARDFDDAISLERLDGGHWRLWVHIADVSHFVPPGGRIDQEAQQRATSVYLPDRVVPMIPEIISNHLASLQPERMRLTKTAEIEFTADGAVVATEVYNSAIRSDRRFNYEQVDNFLADPAASRARWGDAACDLLERMHTLAMRLRRRRMQRGSLNMDLPEVKIDLDRGGKVRGAHLVQNTESHQIIEEFMLAANQAVATWFDDLHLQFLRRIHPPPPRRKFRQLAKFLRDLGIDAEDLESRFGIQRVLDQVAGTPLEYAVNYAVLKAMSKAVYGPYREGHYALDMQHYCHFTSPIRRYPDLTIHRVVQRIVEKHRTPSAPFPALVRMGHHCSDQEKNAEAAERELIRIKLLHHLAKRIGETMPAVVSNITPEGFYARGIELPAEGFVPIHTLPDDRYTYERRGQMLVGFRRGNRFRLGDRVTVRVAKVNLQRRELAFELAGSLNSRPGRSQTAEGKARTTRPKKSKRSKRRETP